MLSEIPLMSWVSCKRRTNKLNCKGIQKESRNRTQMQTMSDLGLPSKAMSPKLMSILCSPQSKMKSNIQILKIA